MFTTKSPSPDSHHHFVGANQRGSHTHTHKPQPTFVWFHSICVVNCSGGNNFCSFTAPRPKSLMSDKDSKINVHEREKFVVHVAHVGVGCRHRLVLTDILHDTTRSRTGGRIQAPLCCVLCCPWGDCVQQRAQWSALGHRGLSQQLGPQCDLPTS